MARKRQRSLAEGPSDGSGSAVAATRGNHRGRRWLVVVGAGLLAAAGVLAFVWAVEPANPGSFYDLPLAAHIGVPGSILRQVAVPTNLNGARVSKILYASTDRTNRPIVVSGVIVVPTGPVPPGGRPIIAWAHGTTGVASRCAPSLEPDAGIGRIPLLRDLVAEGVVVVATDYPGLGTPGTHPYLVGESEGRAVLDSVRAAETVDRGSSSAKVVLMGHSQGGHAVLFAAQLAQSYAPDLHLVGVVAMAPPTDLSELLAQDVHENAGVVLTALAITGWTHTYA
ncbi:MAG TPA: alpha/beta fold hydrolase, partial [Acidimicrobiia bacterium]